MIESILTATYILLSNDVNFYRGQPIHLNVEVCNDSEVRCEPLASSEKWTFDGKGKVVHAFLSANFKKSEIQKAVQLVQESEDNARLKFKVFYKNDPRRSASSHSGYLRNYLVSFEKGGETARSSTYNPETGLIEVSNIHLGQATTAIEKEWTGL